MTEPFFELQGVSKAYAVRSGVFKRGPAFNALHDVNLTLRRKVFYGIVGESGSGKTTLARLLVGLTAPDSGRILCEGEALPQILQSRERHYRSKVQLVFQNPFMSLDPRWRIRSILEEGIREMAPHERAIRISNAMDRVRLKADYLERLPGALSGGERQRVAIARALVMQPEYLILDEPTSQLDVSIQAQILTLLRELRPSLSGGLILITHDLALVAGLAEELVVLAGGKVVEAAATREILLSPRQEYTRRLIASVPRW